MNDPRWLKPPSIDMTSVDDICRDPDAAAAREMDRCAYERDFLSLTHSRHDPDMHIVQAWCNRLLQRENMTPDIQAIEVERQAVEAEWQAAQAEWQAFVLDSWS